MVNVKNIHHFILICSFLFNFSNSAIEIPIKINSQKLPTIPITLGGNQTFSVVVDTGSQHFWVADQSSTINVTTKYTKSETYTNLAKPFSVKYNTGEEVKGELGEDNFIMTSSPQIRMNFGLALTSSLILDDIDGVLGFGRNYINHTELNDKSDLLLQLKNQDASLQRVFSLGYYYDSNTNKLEGTFSLGKVPDHINNSTNTSFTCKVLDSYVHEWACKVSHIIIGDPNSFRTTAIPVNRDAVFNTGSSVNILPIDYLDIIAKRLNKTTDCYNETIEGYEHLYCQNITNLSSIYFVFNEYGMSIDKENFFSYDKTKNNYVFRFMFSNKYDHIVFGTTLLKDYQLIFNGETNVVGFYNKTDTKIVNLSSVMKPHWFAYVLVIILVVLEGVIAFWFVVWCKKSKSLRQTVDSALISAESLDEIGGRLD